MNYRNVGRHSSWRPFARAAITCNSPSVVVAAVVGILLPLASLKPQARDAYVSAGFFGVTTPSAEYEEHCGASSFAFSVDVQGSRRIFPQASLEHFVGSHGESFCVPKHTMGTAVGGLRLKGATRASFGVGGRVRHKILELEGTALGGVIAGRRGYGAVVENGRTTLPQIGGQLKWVAYVWYGSLTRLWTRLPFDVIPADGSPTQRIRTSWSPMTTVQVGVRVGIGR